MIVQGGAPPAVPSAQAARNWAWDQVKTWDFSKQDARGQVLWQNKKFLALAYVDQTEQLIERLGEGGETQRAALLVLGDRPLDQWARAALRKAQDRDEVALYLYSRGYRYPDKDPFVYLEPSSRVERPWTEGMGLHLEGQDAWRFQWIGSPALLPRMEAAGALPKGLEKAPQPGAMLHLRQLKPGLLKLQALAGGEGGMVSALAQGSRLGFFLKHVDVWMKKSSSALEPLAGREAWVLHYGVSRDGHDVTEGTLVFLPGDLPLRAKLGLELLKLNPTSMGPRTQSVTWTGKYGGKAEITQIRGSGGVIHLYAAPEGTWISDREAPLRNLVFPAAGVTLSDRPEWCKVALAGMRKQTDVSLWLLPRLGAGASFERAAIRRRLLGSQQNTWANPFIAKAAPRSGTLSVSLGAGPTEVLIQSILRKDEEAPIDDPRMPVVAEGGKNLTPEQQKAYADELRTAKARRDARKVLRDEVNGILPLLDLRGAAFYWNGWVVPPPLSAPEKASLTEFRKLQRESRQQASEMQRQGKVKFYGGFAEPGMTPSVAMALPLQAGKGVAVEAALKRLWPKLFKGRAESREAAKGILVHRMRTEQAFTPSYAIVNETLVLGSDDAAVQAVVAGVMGQTTTLADLQSKSYGVAQFDGALAARDLETLLLSYLRISQGGRFWWLGEPAPTDDEAGAEMAATFSPFLAAMKQLGTRTLELEWTVAGLEARPR